VRKALTGAEPPAPGDEAAWLRLCGQAASAGDWDEAGWRLEQALAALPASAKLHYNLGVLRQQLGHTAQAVEAWQAVLRLEPAHIAAHHCLAAVFLAEAESRAIFHARSLVALQAESVSAWTLLGRAELAGGNIDEAALAFQQALLRAPADSDARTGQQLTQLIASRGKAAFPAELLAPLKAMLSDTTRGSHLLARDSLPADGRIIYIEYVLQRQKVCDWRLREAMLAEVRELLREADAGHRTEVDGCLPWDALHLGIGEPALQRLARLGCARLRRINQPVPFRPGCRAAAERTRLRIAYLSFNFRDHPTSFLTHRLLAMHDRQAVEVLAYALNESDGSARRGEVEAAVDRFMDCSGMTPAQAAQAIFDDGVDVLIGLGGHAEGPVIDVAMYRPAPVIVNYLAYLGTIGSQGAFDYHIADPVMTPMSRQPWFDEALVHISPGVLSYDDATPIDPVPTRSAAGLPEDALILCGFNNSYKIEPETFTAWCRILTALPESRLWLYIVRQDQIFWLKAAAAERGVEPERLIFAERLPSPAHLARFSLADIYLDTFIYNGHTTMLDALYSGVPAVSRLGTQTVSRVGASFLHALGMQEWVASTSDDYVALVVKLARDVLMRSALRQRLINARGSRLPFDTAARARELETAYLRMFERAAAGLLPAAFSILDC
jgi:protein O-GlcNAc transferase